MLSGGSPGTGKSGARRSRPARTPALSHGPWARRRPPLSVGCLPLSLQLSVVIPSPSTPLRINSSGVYRGYGGRRPTPNSSSSAHQNDSVRDSWPIVILSPSTTPGMNSAKETRSPIRGVPRLQAEGGSALALVAREGVGEAGYTLNRKPRGSSSNSMLSRAVWAASSRPSSPAFRHWRRARFARGPPIAPNALTADSCT